MNSKLKHEHHAMSIKKIIITSMFPWMFQNIYHFHGHQTSWSPIPSINNVHIATIGWANSSGLPWARSLNNVWSIGKSWTSPMTHLLQYSIHFIGNLKWFSKHIFYGLRNPIFYLINYYWSVEKIILVPCLRLKQEWPTVFKMKPCSNSILKY